MKFDPAQLDEIRSRLKVSDVVGSVFPLIKKGNEFVVKGNESFTVSDSKNFWCEFGSGGDGKPHDIFDFMQIHSGLSFPEAVEELARQAGVSLKDGPGRSPSSSNGAGTASASHARINGSGAESSPTGRDDRPDNGLGKAAGGKREVIATWDYLDPENTLLYQTVRMQERMPDGSWRLTKDRKIWKTFLQRRPAPTPGEWVLGLDVVDRETGEPLEFLKTATGTAWLRVTDERLKWNNTTRATFADLGNVEHWLYNANAVIDELQEPRDDQRTIFCPEGEGKVDVLKEWGLLAVTNSGGAKNFTTACAEFFRGARHVVILQDNDRAGAEGAAKKAAMLKAVGVELIQALNFRDVWPACPMKGDVKDWRDHGGTKDQLLEIVDDLKPWTPEPYKSRYGAKTAADLDDKPKQYPWRIKFLVPRNVDTLIMGPSKSGKTFETLNMCMHVHFGKDYAGRRVEQGGVVYLTYEGSEGFENRFRAYMQHNDLTKADLHSFAWLTRPPGLYASEDDAKGVAQEISEIAKTFRLPLSHSVIDTHNAATRGSSEIKSEDLNRIQNNYGTVRTITGCPLWIVGHTNQEGRHRGNEQFFNGIDAALLIRRLYTDEKKKIEKRDDDRRVIRRLSSDKQRDGDDNVSVDFVLQRVVIGKDEFGDDIPSMVSTEPAQSVPDSVVEETTRKAEWLDGEYLMGSNLDVFQALLRSLAKSGQPPPKELGLSNVPLVVEWSHLGREYKKTDPREQDEPIDKYQNRMKARTRRFRADLLRKKVIGVAEMIDPSAVNENPEKPMMMHFIWPTGRRVYGKGLQWPPVPKKNKEQPMILAPGEKEEDLPPF